jgi:hypothetical protein
MNEKSKLFQYAVLYHPKPTKDQAERGERPKSEILTDITTVLAGGDKEVGILAARTIGEDRLANIEDIEILVRPF